jgi:energy-coupling factor transport system permease protein
MSAAIDPDQLLKAMRRLSYRSALTATLATRLVPVLARDAGRMGDAARCRPNPPGRLAVVRAALAGALDRAMEVAAALEVRGYALAGRPARHSRPVSRHDLRIGAAALAVVAVALAGLAAGVGRVDAYPTLELAFGPAELGLASALVLLGAAPLLGRSARLGVARV